MPFSRGMETSRTIIWPVLAASRGAPIARRADDFAARLEQTPERSSSIV